MSSEEQQRWRLTIAYDGQPYQGWQSQPSGNTIQDHLETAIAGVTSIAGIRIHGSGRTDAGVHADGQVAHFDAPARLQLGPENWPMALNTQLPPQIRVLSSSAVTRDFHARYSATGKTYVYRIFLGKILPPMLYGRRWTIHNCLDSIALMVAAEILQGRHNFRYFAANRGSSCPEPLTTVRTVKQITCSQTHDNQWKLTFTGDGFLYKMVRMLVGTMVDYACGKLSETELRSLVTTPPGLKRSACAPADGLYLQSVHYTPLSF